jgi:hypothetical protein
MVTSPRAARVVVVPDHRYEETDMKNILTTGSLAAAALVTAGLVAWQAPAAFADHGADDSTSPSSVVHRHGGDDGAGHDAGDDHGRHGHGHDAGDDHGRHGHGHDAGDDHGRHGHGNDDGANHDAGDDHGGDDHSGHGHGSDD